jgi:hypothetical protein
VSKKPVESALPSGPATVEGVPVVTIPLAEYAELLETRRRFEALHPSTPQPLPRSPIEVNAEISAYIDARLGKMHIHEIAEACRQQFGNRAPSKSAIHRYWQRRRQINPPGPTQALRRP